jgi:hypothetical protein
MVDAKHADELRFLAGGGISGSQLRALDWTASPLGPPAGWPQSLRTAVKLMLNTRQPLSIFWGPEAIHLFNDAAAETFGAERRAGAMAQPGAIVWSEVWEVISPQIDQVMAGGGALIAKGWEAPIVLGKQQAALAPAGEFDMDLCEQPTIQQGIVGGSLRQIDGEASA